MFLVRYGIAKKSALGCDIGIDMPVHHGPATSVPWWVDG